MELNFSNFKAVFGNRQNFLKSKFLLYFVLMVMVFKIASVGVYVNLPKNIFFADITKSALESMANQTRQSLGLNALKENTELDMAAQLKAQDMVKNDYFAHTSPTGLSPWYWFSEVGYNYKYAGENLAIGFFDSTKVYNAWLNSPSHKENIVNSNYTEFGTAVLGGYGSNNTIVVVQLFGSSKPAKTVVAKNTNTKIATPVTKTKTPVAEPENTQPKVLAQSTSSIEPANDNVVKSNIYSKFINLTKYNADQLMQDFVYGISLVVIGILFSLIFFSNGAKLESALILRSLIILGILLASSVVSREGLSMLIPHQIII